MKTIDEMYNFSSKLWYDKRWINKSGLASLYLQVTINGKHKEFPLKIKWPATAVDLAQGILLPRFKRDPDVSDWNIAIADAQSNHHKINRDYRVRNQPLDIGRFCKEILVFNDRDCFITYMESEAKRRFQRKEISRKTFQNNNASRKALQEYDGLSLFKDIDLKWMKHLKFHLAAKHKPGTVWARIKDIKTYLKLASLEPMLYVRQEAIDFPNPKVANDTTYLDTEEIRRLMILSRAGGLTGTEDSVLKAFLFTCFTSLRISDVYRANSKWRVANGVLKFIPKKNERKGVYHTINLMPMAETFIHNIGGQYFDLPTEQEYNRTLKELAVKADIKKRLTSHVGRHTFGFIYMDTRHDIHGLQEVMGHKKLETTQRYAHLGEDYQKEAVREIQSKFSDLVIRKVL
jgi:integrase/recombinase XerD